MTKIVGFLLLLVSLAFSKGESKAAFVKINGKSFAQIVTQTANSYKH